VVEEVVEGGTGHRTELTWLLYCIPGGGGGGGGWYRPPDRADLAIAQHLTIVLYFFYQVVEEVMEGGTGHRTELT
jgi:hypothetical protein